MSYVGLYDEGAGRMGLLHDIWIPLLVGIALFLFGMKVMELAMHYWAGPHLKRVLERFTATPFRGMLTGTGLTALLQSSSAITVITIGLVNAQLLAFPQTLGIILGTNIGTCLTTELVGLNITHMAFPLLYIGAAIWLVSWIIPQRAIRSARHASTFLDWLHAFRYISLAVCGFACLLIGMEVMQSIVPSLQSRGMFMLFLEYAQKSVLWGVLAGAMLTAVIQSSSATIAVTMALASVHAISLDLGIAIVIGANIGTCGTALIASIGGSRAGQFVAWSHVLLNVGGALLFTPLIPVLQSVTEWLSSHPSSQVAHAQTIYNIVCSLLALPICYLKVFTNSTKSITPPSQT